MMRMSAGMMRTSTLKSVRNSKSEKVFFRMAERRVRVFHPERKNTMESDEIE